MWMVMHFSIFFSVDRKLVTFRSWCEQSLCLADWLWQDSPAAPGIVHWSQKSLGGKQSRRWIPDRNREPDHDLLSADSKTGGWKNSLDRGQKQLICYFFLTYERIRTNILYVYFVVFVYKSHALLYSKFFSPYILLMSFVSRNYGKYKVTLKTTCFPDKSSDDTPIFQSELLSTLASLSGFSGKM